MSSTPVSEARSAATGGTGLQVSVGEPVETRLRALRASAGSITTQLSRSRMIGVVAAASDAISASDSGLVPSASRQSNANIASGPKRPVISGPSPRTCSTSARGSSWARSPRGQKASTPIASSAPTPCSSRSPSSSPASTTRSGTGSRRSRPSVGQATAARRSSVTALSRARREKPWQDPSHSVAASVTWPGSSRSCTCSTTVSSPSASCSAGASTRRLTTTSTGRSPGRSPGRSRSAAWLSETRRRCGWTRAGVRVMVSATASRRPRIRASASAASTPSKARAFASRRTASVSSPVRGPTCQASPASHSRIRPAATSLSASTVAPPRSPTEGCASSARSTRLSTGIAPRIGSRTTRSRAAPAPPVNSTSLSRGGCVTVRVAGPCNGTKLTVANVARPPDSAPTEAPRSPSSPDPDALLGVEPQAVVLGRAERLVELVEVAHDVGAELGRTVRVDGEQLELLLLAALGAPAVGPVHEQPLAAGGLCLPGTRLSVSGFARLRGVLECDRVGLVGDGESAEVADVLADGQRAVDVLAGEVAGLECVVLRDQRLRLHLERRLVVGGPPVVEVAGAVVLCALVVEAVPDLVTDHGADAAVVLGRPAVRGEEGPLQDAGREADLVGGRLVVGVDLVREHQPLVAVDRRADLAQLSVGLERGRREQVAEQVVGADLQRRVVTPRVGVADLRLERVELVERALLGLLAHPVQAGDAAPVGLEEVGDELVHHRLGLRRE